jgi:GT2 family glycosyltransferase
MISKEDALMGGIIGIIVVNWNNWKLTLDCLASLRSSQNADWHLFLVDNNSTDESSDMLRDLGDDVTVIWSKVNGGWTGGNNLGLQAAFKFGVNQVFILNNDAQVKTDTLAKLRERAALSIPSPILGPIQRNEFGALDFVGAVSNPRTGMPVDIKAHEIHFDEFPEVYNTAYIRGAGIFASREHFESVGFFDDDFYLNYDESDWCFRARKNGFLVAMFKGSEIIHIGSASIGGGDSPIAAYFMARNGLLFAERHCSSIQRARAGFHMLRWMSNLSVQSSRLGRLTKLVLGSEPSISAARLGIKDYLKRRFGNCPDIIRTLNRSSRAG